MTRIKLVLTIKKGRKVKDVSFILTGLSDQSIQNEVRYWRWNMEVLGGWKILGQELTRIRVC